MPEITCQQCGRRFTSASRQFRFCPACAAQRTRESRKRSNRRAHGWTDEELAAGSRRCALCGDFTGVPRRKFCAACAHALAGAGEIRTAPDRKPSRSQEAARRSRLLAHGWSEEEIAAGSRRCALCGSFTGSPCRIYCPVCIVQRTRDYARDHERRLRGWTEADIAVGKRIRKRR